MAFGDLTNKLEAAAAALLAASLGSTLAVKTGQAEGKLTRPVAIVKAEQGDEFPQGTGNFKMQLTAQVQASADDTGLTAHRGFFAAVVDVLRDDEVAASLSAQQSDFHVLGVNNPRYNELEQDRAHVSELTLEVYCCASDLS